MPHVCGGGGCSSTACKAQEVVDHARLADAQSGWMQCPAQHEEERQVAGCVCVFTLTRSSARGHFSDAGQMLGPRRNI